MRITVQMLALAAMPKPLAGRALAEPERATLARMAEVVLEGSPAKLPMEQIIDNFDRFLLLGRSQRAWRCRLLLMLVEYAPIAVFGRPLRSLSLEERRRFVVEKLARGGFLWSVCAKVRYFAYVGAYGDSVGVRATGFKPFDERARARERKPAGRDLRPKISA